MFTSFFPRPGLFFLSALGWWAVVAALWYLGGSGLGAGIGLPPLAADAEPVIGLGYFVTPDFIWFYLWTFSAFALFAAAWMILMPHPWQLWSVGVSGVIIFTVYFDVQVSVALNNWRRPFFDNVQGALSGTPVGQEVFQGLLGTFAAIAFLAIGIGVATRFLASHYVFRWRTAMNDYYMARWQEVRRIEGASQRVQEDTMRFAGIAEELGVKIIESVLTLIAFLPILSALSSHVSELPLVGAVPQPLVLAAIFWALFGTSLLALAGIRLPGLNFLNQRVEASYRKELVYGEDDAGRAAPATVRDLFGNVRRNYFRMYFHYAYFNVVRFSFLQADNIFGFVILVPTIVAGKITFGILQQILTAFRQVSESFQFLVNSWTTIIELLSIQKRLAAFEAAFEGRPFDAIETGPDAAAPFPDPRPGAR